jgi:hypothetical protein
MELFTVQNSKFFWTTRGFRYVHHGWHGTHRYDIQVLATYVPPLPRDLAELKARFIAAVKNIDAPILTRVWQELEYRIDVCCVIRGAHIEHSLLSKKENLFSFPVAVKNSIKVDLLVFLLETFVITENIMKRPILCHC